MASVDSFTVPAMRFQILDVFLVLAHDRRRILHYNGTAHPAAEWTAQQLREAFPRTAPRDLLRHRNRIFGDDFVEQRKAMGIQEALSAPRSLWPRAYVGRATGTIRRECLERVIGPTSCWPGTRRNRDPFSRPSGAQPEFRQVPSRPLPETSPARLARA